MLRTLVCGAFLFGLFQDSPAPTERAKLVAENGANSSYKDGVFELKSGRGWLRTPRLFLDFEIEFDFRRMTPEADAALLIRTWTGKNQWPQRGLRVPLPTNTSLSTDDLLVGRNERVKVIQQGQLALREADEWQRIRVVAEGPRVEITLNDILAGVFEVDRFGGHVMFENREGRVEIRDIKLHAREPPSMPPDVIQFEELEKAGGRPPKLTHEVKPLYTRETTQRLVQGVVSLEAVVRLDGSVGAVRVKRSLDPTLDLSAIAALKGWRFVPAVLNNKPVAVIVHVEMTFTLT